VARRRTVPRAAALVAWLAAPALVTTGCGSGAAAGGGPAARHAERVDAVVIRSLSDEGAELGAEAMRRARAEAVLRVAEAVDPLDAPRVEELRLDISIAEVERRASSVRARCLVTVSTVGPPERTRSILEGAATVRHSSGDAVAAATEAAVRAALRRLPQALAAL